MQIIFVFGSNLAGRHGAGAANYAVQHFGAKYGVGEGPSGWTYAIPTKDEHLIVRPLKDIQLSVEAFLDYARRLHEFPFKVTRVGCGLAKLTDSQMAPMFLGAPENCGFDPAWRPFGLRTWKDVGIL